MSEDLKLPQETRVDEVELPAENDSQGTPTPVSEKGVRLTDAAIMDYYIAELALSANLDGLAGTRSAAA